jgi:hypothetical protein
MCPTFNGCEHTAVWMLRCGDTAVWMLRCGDTAVWMLRIKHLTKGMKERQMTYWLHLLVM